MKKEFYCCPLARSRNFYGSVEKLFIKSFVGLRNYSMVISLVTKFIKFLDLFYYKIIIDSQDDVKIE